MFLAIASAGVLCVHSQTSVFGGDPGMTGLIVRDREQHFHRLRHIRTKRPDDPANTYQIANLYYSLQMEDEAIKEYRRCLRLDPAHVNAKWFLSKLLVSKGYYEEAFWLVREILDVKIDDLEVYYWAGEILEKLGEHKAAKEYFVRCDDLLSSPP